MINPIYPYHPNEILLGEIKGNVPSPPDSNHILGTDVNGRDVFSRVFHAFGYSMTYALLLTILSYTIGIIMGGLFGYFGGLFDLFGQRLMEIFNAIPFLYAIMILNSFIRPKTVFGSLTLLLILNILLGSWMGISYYMRGEFLEKEEKIMSQLLFSMGARTSRIILKHIFPNSINPVITFLPFNIMGNISSITTLDYLGFGLSPPAASWGELLSEGQRYIVNWWLIASPTGALFITLILITFVGEGIREAFDPREYSRLR